ncbi:hypothetical protein TNCV_815751 [Trichonephila clavipes]|nr:hypothetical protein TNCV_815751 [Trichonephila clavipes]
MKGHGCKLVAGIVLAKSGIQILVPLNIYHVERLMHVRSVGTQALPINVMWKLAEWSERLRCRSRNLIRIQNYEVSRQYFFGYFEM